MANIDSKDIRVLGPHGPTRGHQVPGRDVTKAARHWNAVRRFLETGDETALHEFDDESVSSKGEDGFRSLIPLLTDPDVIERLALRGQISFESIYDEVQ